MTDFGDIRSTLQHQPSQTLWDTLCVRVEQWASAQPDAFEQEGLPYVRNHLKRWPVELCRAPEDWLEDLFHDRNIHPGFGIIRTIELRDRDLEEEEVESIAFCRWLDFVNVLDFSRSRRTVWRRHNLYTGGIATLAQSRWLNNLTVFRAAGHHIRPEGLRQIGQSQKFSTLKTLDMAHNNFGFLRSVGHEPWCLDQLDDLILRDTELSWPGIDYLLNTGILSNLVSLDLSDNEIEDQGIELLFDTLNYPRLTTLNLAGCKLQTIGANMLSYVDGLSALTFLDMSNNGLGSDGACALAQSPAFSKLQGLGFQNNNLDAQGLQAIVESEYLKNLTRLELSDNHLNAAAMEHLANWPGLAQCKTLNLSNNRLDDDAIVALLNSPHLGGVTTLNLNANQISDEGARRLAQHNNTFQSLERLNLNDNQITERGFRPFATRSQHGNLKALSAFGNPFNIEQMRDIVEHTVPFEWSVSLETGWYQDEWDEDVYDAEYE